jgi:L-2,4-diaminobutyrate decarboxylase
MMSIDSIAADTRFGVEHESESTALAQARQRILKAYDPQAFAQAGRDVVDEIAGFLDRSQRSDGAVLNWRQPLDNISDAAALIDGGANADVRTLVRTIFSRGQTMHDPRYIGHQVPPPVPVSAMFEAVSSISNQGMTIYEMGPWSSAVERVMLARLGETLGLAPGFGGVLTSGGSLANLTALLTARNIALRDVWKQGAAVAQGAVIIAHGESHYCVERAAGIIGIGTENCLRAALDERGKMDARKLADQLDRLKQEGRTVIAVVASACSTRTGAYDPLRAIAAVCRRYGVWFHVDAAHGGAAAFSEAYAHYLDGIDEADSIVWDAHKMMFMPALSTYLFYRRSTDQYHAVSQQASYLFDENAQRADAFNTGLGTIECTKRAAAFSLWATWAIHGKRLFADLIDTTYGVARQFAARIDAHPDCVLLNTPEANILVFRYVPPALRQAEAERVGAFQNALRKKIIESGEFYIVPAMDQDIGALRLVVMNPLTTEAHFDRLLDSLSAASAALLNA